MSVRKELLPTVRPDNPLLESSDLIALGFTCLRIGRWQLDHWYLENSTVSYRMAAQFGGELQVRVDRMKDIGEFTRKLYAEIVEDLLEGKNRYEQR